MSSLEAALGRLYAVLDALSFPWCRDCAQCCSMPWVNSGERARLEALPGVDLVEQAGVHFVGPEGCCGCLSAGRCGIYRERPLDCRLFPLDIVEEGGALWWCIFLNCRAPAELASVLVPAIPALEAHLTPALVADYLRQITVTRASWAPYRDGQYRLVRPVVLPAAGGLETPLP